MKKTLFLALAWALAAAASAQTISDSVWRADVKTVLFYCENAEQEMPVLTLGENRRMALQFDMLGDEPLHLRYTLFHCDARWQRDDLQPYEFMTGFETGIIEGYDFSFTTLVPYVHYHQTVPDRYANFLVSGNYILSVSLEDEPDSILFTRRFCVSEQGVGIKANLTKPYDGMSIDRRQEVDVKVESGEWKTTSVSLRPEYLQVLVQQNRRQDNARWLSFSGYDGTALCYRYRQENIFDGGNNFRFFDVSNLHSPMYNVQRIGQYGGETFALLKPEEDRSRKHFNSETVLTGGMKVNVWDRTNKALEADYVWVNFSLPMPQPFLDGSIHIVGALTDWQLDTLSRMDYRPDIKAYTKRLLLKQGYYSYQLLFLPVGKKEAETARLEGNHRETPNVYTIFVYHRTPADRSDRLMGVQCVVAP